MRHYQAVLIPEPEVGAYSVMVPALPGCFTQGATIEETLERAPEAIAAHLSALGEQGEAAPEDVTPLVYQVAVDDALAVHR
jgi:predicted RNase H-like HicB family nuclease